jgi:UPF0271 protein
MRKVDLNVDIGEGFPYDEALLEFATSANICCGEHAGSWELTERTIDMCLRKGTRVGCHPGFPDRPGFGRKIPMENEASAFCQSVVQQIKKSYGYQRPAYIKPHGALYHLLTTISPQASAKEKSLIAALSGALFGVSIDLKRPTFMLLPESYFAKAVRMPPLMLRVIKEGFADRRYNKDGTLVPRSGPHAILEDPQEIAAQVLRIVPKVDSICLHGDTPNCLEFAELVNKTLVDAGYEVGF